MMSKALMLLSSSFFMGLVSADSASELFPQFSATDDFDELNINFRLLQTNVTQAPKSENQTNVTTNMTGEVVMKPNGTEGGVNGTTGVNGSTEAAPVYSMNVTLAMTFNCPGECTVDTLLADPVLKAAVEAAFTKAFVASSGIDETLIESVEIRAAARRALEAAVAAAAAKRKLPELNLEAVFVIASTDMNMITALKATVDDGSLMSGFNGAIAAAMTEAFTAAGLDATGYSVTVTGISATEVETTVGGVTQTTTQASSGGSGSPAAAASSSGAFSTSANLALVAAFAAVAALC